MSEILIPQKAAWKSGFLIKMVEMERTLKIE